MLSLLVSRWGTTEVGYIITVQLIYRKQLLRINVVSALSYHHYVIDVGKAFVQVTIWLLHQEQFLFLSAFSRKLEPL